MKYNIIIKNGKISLVVIALLSNATLSFAVPSSKIVTNGNARDSKNTKSFYSKARVRTNPSAKVNIIDNSKVRINHRVRNNASTKVNIIDNGKVRINHRVRANNTEQK